MYIAAMRAPTPEQRRQEVENFRESVTQRDWLIMAKAWSASSVDDIVGSLRTPTLILHPRDYENVPVDESIKAAAKISDARLILIDGNLEYGDAAEGIRAIESFSRRPAL
jgi:pimeloyl-ACP methyl ester carboxylesterase